MRIDSSFIADFVFAAVIYLILLFTLWKNKGVKKIVVNSIMYFYIVAVFTVTVMPVIENIKYIGTFDYRYMRLVPFDDYNCGRVAAFKQIILNTVMFIPFGFLLPMINTAERRTYMIFLLSLELSLIIEVVQLFSRVGSFDVDDLILNTMGGLIGYWAYRAIRSLGRKIAD